MNTSTPTPATTANPTPTHTPTARGVPGRDVVLICALLVWISGWAGLVIGHHSARAEAEPVRGLESAAGRAHWQSAYTAAGIGFFVPFLFCGLWTYAPFKRQSV